MSETTIRWDCTKHLVDLLRNHGALDGVLIEPGYPGDKNLRPEMIWTGDIDGQISIPVGMGGRKSRDDLFQIPFIFRVAGSPTLDKAKERMAVMVAAAEDVFADDPTLGDFPSVVSAEIVQLRDEAQETPGGVMAYALMTVEIHSRLS